MSARFVTNTGLFVEISDRTLMLAGQLAIVWLPDCKIILRVFPHSLRISVTGTKENTFDISEVDEITSESYERLYEQAVDFCKKDPAYIHILYD